MKIAKDFPGEKMEQNVSRARARARVYVCVYVCKQHLFSFSEYFN